MTAAAANLDEVLALYDAFGDDRDDERLGHLAHGLQTAAQAESAGASPELVVAALLHDVGHLLARPGGPTDRERPGTDDLHEQAGARYLAPVFPPAVTAPIALHVEAKRYRCAVDAEYHALLSEGSVRSLVVQGGPMTDDEAAAFAARPGSEEAVLLRRWDDAGKVPGLHVPDLAHYQPLLAAVARR